MSITPASNPKLSRLDAEHYLYTFEKSVEKYPVRLLGIRGYYKKTMGNPTTNDFGIYDDALCILSPTLFATFNFNTDPSRQTPGLSILQAPQLVLYKRGIHKISVATKEQLATMLRTGKDIPGIRPHWALRQFSNVTVLKHGTISTDTPATRRWINLHRGGITLTNSEGCQTVPPEDYSDFYDNKLVPELAKYNQEIIPYVLVNA